jgi:hypothetical protein
MYKTIDHYSEQDETLVCHNDKDVFHYIQAKKGQFTTTAQPNLEIFKCPEEAVVKFEKQINDYNLKWNEKLDASCCLSKIEVADAETGSVITDTIKSEPDIIDSVKSDAIIENAAVDAIKPTEGVPE